MYSLPICDLSHVVLTYISKSFASRNVSNTRRIEMIYDKYGTTGCDTIQWSRNVSNDYVTVFGSVCTLRISVNFSLFEKSHEKE